MFLVKNVYLFVSLICSIFVTWSLIDSVLKKTQLSYAVAGMNLSAMACLVPFLLAIFIKNETISGILYGVYLGGLDFSNYMFLMLIIALEGGDRSLKKRDDKTVISTFQIICVVDYVFLILNFIHQYYYEMQPISVYGECFCYQPKFRPFFVFHLIACYGMAIYNSVRLIADARSVTNFYKNKFYIVLTFYLLVFSLNSTFLFFKNSLILDYSLIVYEIFSLITYDFALYIIPKGIRKNMLAVSSKNISDAVLCFDNKGKCIYQNELAKKISSSNGQNLEWVDQYFKQDKDVVQTTQTINFDDDLHIFNAEFRRIKDKSGKLSGSYLKLNDRTDDIKNLETQQFRSTHDELTGLYNRNCFFKEVKRVLRNHLNEPFYMIATNIKNFKLINDLFGSQMGDNILLKQAQMLSFAVYEGVVVGRISGDKFGMLIKKKNFKMDMAVANTKSITDSLKDINYPIIMKIGVYEISDPYEDVHIMFDKANLAIKNNNDDNQVLTFYSSSLLDKLVHERNVINEFEYALENNQFKMFLQPQVDSQSEKCIGSEALVRWQNPDGSFRHPGDFIPILEKAGLIFQLDQFIWEKAAQQLGEWKKNGFENFYISVNISVKDFYYGDLYKIFTGLIKKYDINPKQLNLEITESVLIGDKLFHRQILSKLHDFGFGIEMDDFGSGYSSLNALKDMQMDVLKIDMEFLNETNNELRGKTIIKSIVKMAKALGMTVISEGVENESQTTFLKTVGVDIFQGYLYSKPIPVDEYEKKYMGGEK